ncbi:MAG: DNA gyrase inhibitor YacG [Caulobacterales bacterium]
MTAARKTEAPCPICKRPADAAFRPFCSKRCADVDLHRWLAGRYAIPAKDQDDDEAESLPDDREGD